MYSAARRPAKNNRHRDSPPVITLRSVVHYLIEGASYEVYELKFNDGAKADCGRSAGRAHKSRFTDGRINDAIRAELFEKALSDFKSAAECPYVFAEDEHALVALHLASERSAYSLKVSNVGHNDFGF
jgi:hypothetical protein